LFLNSPLRENLASGLFPTKTLNLQQLVTRAALTAQANATPTPGPTITTMFFPTKTGTPDATVVSQSPTQANPTPVPATSTPTVAAPTPVAQTTLVATVPAGGNAACIPPNPPQKGKVLDIVDGNTIKVLIDGPVYTVRYIGVAVPDSPTYASAATFQNGKLVFTKEVTLVADAQDKDSMGRLLRYVIMGDTFVNQEMIAKGWGSAVDVPPNSSCAQTFAAAEQAARASQLGRWAPAGAVPTP
jgi:endonuclease YncB( thermonuclease family)